MPSRLPFLLLLVVILLESRCGHAEAQGKLQKPDISVDGSVQNSRVVNIACDTKLENPITSTNISCNLYIGDSSEPFRRTWTTSKTVCNFEVNISDLLKSRGVSCDYSVNIDPRSLSPRSKKGNILGKPQEPDISVDAVQNSGEVNIVCETMLKNLTPVTNISCNLYIGASSEPFRRTWTTNEVCTFAVNVNDQLKSREVSCDYSVNIDPHSLSPRSKKANIVGKLPKAELHLSPAVISIEESVNLRCSRPDSAPASHCTFTTNQRGPISGSDCERSVTGAELLSGSQSARNEITMTCFYRLEGAPALQSDPSKVTVLGKLPKAELHLSPAVISIKDSMNLRCSRPAPASHCTFTTNQRREISGSDCERKVTGAELLSGSHSARNEIIMRCFYSLEEGGKPARHSEPSTVTVLDLRKPNISVSTEHTETRIRCEAPPDITRAIFFLYYNRSRTPSKSTQAGTEERAFSFTLPRSSDSTLTYCCRYQFEGFNSELSDCAEAKNKDQSGRTKDQRSTTTDNPQTAVTDSSSAWLKTPANIGVILTVIVILLGMTGAGLYWIHRKRKSSGLPTTPNNDAVYTTVDVSKGAETSDATSPSDVTYSTVAHVAPQTTAFQAQQDNVVYSSLKTD